MLFSGITFLFYFLPIVVILYYLVPYKLKNLVLLAASLFFYAWGEPKYVFLMIFSIVVGYVCGLAIEGSKKTCWRRFWLVLGVLVGLGLLGFFKYWDFLVESLNSLIGGQFSLLHLTLPIGISFYTFQILSYVIDVYRGQAAAQKNLISFGTYVSLFPQLIAGPIVRYVDIAAQLKKRSVTMEKFFLGLRRFLFGLGKKVLLANQFGALCAAVSSSGGQSIGMTWLVALGYTLQIYFDFSGYSDMAIGLGQMFGFTFMENFNYPYVSKSITEFWRRWHISLGQWFRDYVYIPLGGNRVSKGKWLRNIFIVWLLTGLWHGAAWTFVSWGLFYALLLVLEKLWLKPLLEKLPGWISHLYVLFFVVMGFVIFQSADFAAAGNSFAAMFGFGGLPLGSAETGYYFMNYLVLFLIGILGATPWPKQWVQKLQQTKPGKILVPVLSVVAMILLLAVCTGYLVDGSFNPFLYFRF